MKNIKNTVRKIGMVFALTFSANALSADFSVTYNNTAGQGFNDNTAVAATPTNLGTTLGQQRRNVVEAALEFWEAKLVIREEVKVELAMNPLSCSNTSATLGAAGPVGYLSSTDPIFPGRKDTLYPLALMNQIIGADTRPSDPDLTGQFNVNIGSAGCLPSIQWHYGINDNTPANKISFYDTILHEIGHGLGMISLVNGDGRKFSGKDDIYSSNLINIGSKRAWTDMSNSERASNSRSGNNLGWSGSNVRSLVSCLNQGVNQGYPRLYAPSTYASSSSVSHWDTALSPNELMEPFITRDNGANFTLMAFKDMGWQLKNTPSRCFNTTKKETTIIPDKALLLLLN